MYVDNKVIWHVVLCLGLKCSLSILNGARVASYHVLGHLSTYFLSCALVASCFLVGQLSTDLHVVSQFIGKLASGNHFYGQDEYWDILARVFIARCESSFHIFNMLDVIIRGTGHEEVFSHVKIIFEHSDPRDGS